MSQSSTDRPRRPPSGKDPGSEQSQRQRFIEAARELGCDEDEDEDALKARMKRLAQSKPAPLKSLVKNPRKKPG